MPELPEVETICTALRKVLLGAKITAAEQNGKLRKEHCTEELNAFCKNKKIEKINRRGKYILIEFSDKSGLILHLGMTGAFVVDNDIENCLKHERTSWFLADGRRWRYNDARRFGAVQICEAEMGFDKHPALKNLGIEPLSAGFNGAYLKKITENSRMPIKNFIMNQNKIVGVGNIYASEALFMAGIAPDTVAGKISLQKCNALVKAIKEVLKAAIKAGGSTIKDFHSVNGEEGLFANELKVYGRKDQECYKCKSKIKKIVQAGRASFFCPKCQKPRN